MTQTETKTEVKKFAFDTNARVKIHTDAISEYFCKKDNTDIKIKNLSQVLKYFELNEIETLKKLKSLNSDNKLTVTSFIDFLVFMSKKAQEHKLI